SQSWRRYSRLPPSFVMLITLRFADVRAKIFLWQQLTASPISNATILSDPQHGLIARLSMVEQYLKAERCISPTCSLMPNMTARGYKGSSAIELELAFLCFATGL